MIPTDISVSASNFGEEIRAHEDGFVDEEDAGVGFQVDSSSFLDDC